MSLPPGSPDPERVRLAEDEARTHNWKRWGPYLAERQWGTVREDYSADGDAWRYFDHEQARSRAYRWGEDGLLGFTDRECRLCFAVALWNGRDPFLKERLFGLSGPEGNHGEDVKEVYFYLDATPTHTWNRALYQYPHARFPYEELRAENRRRTRNDPEYELADTGVFAENRFFDIEVQYAKAGPDDVCIRIVVTNRGPEFAPLHVLPTLWFRNSWSWGCDHEGCEIKPRLREVAPGRVRCDHATLDRMIWQVEPATDGTPVPLLFTENETNAETLFGAKNPSPYVKDAFHAAVVGGRAEAVNPAKVGTKVAAHHSLVLGPGESRTLRLRLHAEATTPKTPFGRAFETVMNRRQDEADQFFDSVLAGRMSAEERKVARQAYAGLLWSKQFYHYVVREWLDGDPLQPPPPPERRNVRNEDWGHLFNRDILSMPDTWEYPWFAAWDTAFHMVAMARIDPHFAKEQLNLLLREWYLHPNGQMPAYEWALSDVNPPVHAWACWRVYKLTGARGKRDRVFLARTFQKLLLNFTWWVNRKDAQGNNIFEGGFLGLDNIGAFDRSEGLPGGGELEQADGTSWMAMYSLNMLGIALELAKTDPVYEDLATKFFEHFIYIGAAMNRLGGQQGGLWHEAAGYYFDVLHLPDGSCQPVAACTIAGTVPVAAVATGDEDALSHFTDFNSRYRWFASYRPDLLQGLADLNHRGVNNRFRLALVDSQRLIRILGHVLNEDELLSPYGVRSASRQLGKTPFVMTVAGQRYVLDYEPAESTTGLFGGNSNWRGPVWFPLNFLLIEALQQHYYFHGDALKIEFPSGSGQMATLWQVTTDLTRRLISIFLKDEHGRRPMYGEGGKFQTDPHWRDYLLFHEYFHGDTGRGLGAGHQTGWTALVAKLIHQYGEYALANSKA